MKFPSIRSNNIESNGTHLILIEGVWKAKAEGVMKHDWSFGSKKGNRNSYLINDKHLLGN